MDNLTDKVVDLTSVDELLWEFDGDLLHNYLYSRSWDCICVNPKGQLVHMDG